ncbi:extracellular solute-binding protein [Arthrobacter sp. FW305-BF8]|uniref:ABC transporter substrate-binding protein n=1 Tax=Arthrobacter sp. FW305-BF8 TaxID=2879617 RepID=UPI001F302DA7|nr:extracellular solute-binding protein [Arthrobacter sp. FW305-BF8]UKA53829.1 extracellular solute-binding protein [Arthrobacter sp. FW305-BF8]
MMASKTTASDKPVPRSLSRYAAAGVASALLLALTACGGSSPAAAPAPVNSIATGQYPDYYPADYKDLVAAAEKEGGELTIYSNTDQENWAPVFRDFRKKYPFVKEISANNLGSDEVFQRVLSENATGTSPADVLVTNAAGAWADFAARGDLLAKYTSPELAKLPEFAQLLPGVTAMSADAMTITYNTSLLPTAPTGLASLAQQAKEKPELFKDKIGLRDIEGAFGFTVFHSLTKSHPEAWDSLATILPLSRPESSSATEKVLAGEYVASALVSAAPAFPVVKDSGGLFKIALPDDGTVVLPRGLGVAAKAPHAATAKLFTDFTLSAEGQQAIQEGGLSSYREGVKPVEFSYTYDDIVKEVGKEDVILVPYEKVSAAETATFTERWNSLKK